MNRNSANQSPEVFVQNLEKKLTDIWLNAPIQYRKLNAGCPEGNGGSLNQILSNWQTLENLLIGLGPDVLYRFIQLADMPETEISREDLAGSCIWILYNYGIDNKFAALQNCGLTGLIDISIDYFDIVEGFRIDNFTRLQFRQATEAFWRLIVRLHRWNHMFFPWNQAAVFAQRNPDEINSMTFEILPPHPNKERVSSKVDLRNYEFTPGVHPKTGNALPPESLTDPKWQSFISIVERHFEEISLNEPWETKKISLGLINGNAGTGFQWFSDIVHALIYLNLSGPIVIYGMTAGVNENAISVEGARKITKIILHDTFNAFEFLGDLGFQTIANLGELYWKVLDDPQTGKDQLIQTNSAFLSYINRTLSWANSVYPWNLAGRFERKLKIDSVRDFNAFVSPVVSL